MPPPPTAASRSASRKRLQIENAPFDSAAPAGAFPPNFCRTFTPCCTPKRTAADRNSPKAPHLVSSALSGAVRFWLPDHSRNGSWARQFRGSQQEGMRGRRSRCGNPTVGVTKRAGEIAPKLENCAEFRAVWLDTREALTSQRAPPRLGSGRRK